MTTQTGPRLTITGTCEGCAHLRTSNVVLTCSHPQIRKGLTGFAIIATKASHEAWDMRGDVRHDCPLLPAARLALARSVVAGDRPERSYQGPMPFVEDEDAPRSRRPSDEEEPTR